ncbi:MAG: D-tyrosyl-tRNA(Tyr) deacylase [Erysipelotrichaceae bacterium]|nr:MAG: D-tyrosyl-tRNA(Tyr) [Erysipelotrichaceae bacterium]TXT19961.1 MAG: D-tyrosyl-tRNA(Tyr) deacylase [Erysipelotrichaceae bacterium]
MKVLVQKVKEAKVYVNGVTVGQIGTGCVLYVGFSTDDTLDHVIKMASRIPLARLFEDDQGKMNLSVMDVGGSLLSISQFTLMADTSKGHRPSLSQAMDPIQAEKLYESFNRLLSEKVHVETGRFRALMEIHQINDGPVSILYES